MDSVDSEDEEVFKPPSPTPNGYECLVKTITHGFAQARYSAEQNIWVYLAGQWPIMPDRILAFAPVPSRGSWRSKQKLSRDSIFVMKSFRLSGDCKSPDGSDYKVEDGYTMLWESMEDIEEYFEHIRAGGDDRPFESRWYYIVVERVYFGPYSHNEVVGWWHGVPTAHHKSGIVTGYDIIKLKESPLPWAEHSYNFTISS